MLRPLCRYCRSIGTQRDLEAVKRLIDRVAGTLGGILIMVTVLAVTAAPLITALFAPGFYMNDSHKFALAVEMLRLTFPYLLLISLTAFAGSVLNSYGRFAVPAFTPVFLNVFADRCGNLSQSAV